MSEKLGYDLKFGAYKDECTGTYWLPMGWPLTSVFVPTDTLWEIDDTVYRQVERKDMGGRSAPEKSTIYQKKSEQQEFLESQTKFTQGDFVNKKDGYKFPGIVVSVFKNLNNQTRYVVECTSDDVKGCLHVFNEDQLEHQTFIENRNAFEFPAT